MSDSFADYVKQFEAFPSLLAEKKEQYATVLEGLQTELKDIDLSLGLIVNPDQVKYLVLSYLRENLPNPKDREKVTMNIGTTNASTVVGDIVLGKKSTQQYRMKIVLQSGGIVGFIDKYFDPDRSL